jgi:hypothetical protein
VRKDAKKEERTIVNQYHGVSSSAEAHRNVSGQTGRRTWKILERKQRPKDEKIHSINVPCAGFMLCTSGLEVVFPSKAMELQEMGVDGQGRTEPELMITKYFLFVF